MRLVITAIACLSALATAAPVAAEVDPGISETFRLIAARAWTPPYKITAQECTKERKAGFEFCLSGQNLCSSKDDRGNTKWESVKDSKLKCPSSGWTNNPSIVRVKVG